MRARPSGEMQTIKPPILTGSRKSTTRSPTGVRFQVQSGFPFVLATVSANLYAPGTSAKSAISYSELASSLSLTARVVPSARNSHRSLHFIGARAELASRTAPSLAHRRRTLRSIKSIVRVIYHAWLPERTAFEPSSLVLHSDLVDADISNPIPLSAQETRPVILTLKIGSLPAQAGKIQVFKCVDVYDGVKSIINLTGDNRHHTTAGTNVKYRGLRSK